MAIKQKYFSHCFVSFLFHNDYFVYMFLIRFPFVPGHFLLLKLKVNSIPFRGLSEIIVINIVENEEGCKQSLYLPLHLLTDRLVNALMNCTPAIPLELARKNLTKNHLTLLNEQVRLKSNSIM